MSKLDYLILFLVVFLMCGCATITPVYNKNGTLKRVESKKFLADLMYTETITYDPQGNILSKHIAYETKTNADRILGATNELVGTLSGVARDLAP